MGAGRWTRCGKCGQVAVHHVMASYACRPCGHADGDHYLADLDDNELALMQDQWSLATNTVKWRP